MKLHQPVPELPVADLERAQRYYRDVLGCKIEWTFPGEIGTVSNGKTAIFFRQRNGAFEPAVHWIFIDDMDAAYKQMVETGANIVDDIENKSWGMRQFSIKDLDGNVFHIHHDLWSNRI